MPRTRSAPPAPPEPAPEPAPPNEAEGSPTAGRLKPACLFRVSREWKTWVEELATHTGFATVADLLDAALRVQAQVRHLPDGPRRAGPPKGLDSPGRPRRRGGKPPALDTVSIVATPEWKTWAAGLASRLGTGLVPLLDLAARDYARTAGFRPAPPRRPT